MNIIKTITLYILIATQVIAIPNSFIQAQNSSSSEPEFIIPEKELNEAIKESKEITRNLDFDNFLKKHRLEEEKLKKAEELQYKKQNELLWKVTLTPYYLINNNFVKKGLNLGLNTNFGNKLYNFIKESKATAILKSTINQIPFNISNKSVSLGLYKRDFA